MNNPRHRPNKPSAGPRSRRGPLKRFQPAVKPTPDLGVPKAKLPVPIIKDGSLLRWFSRYSVRYVEALKVRPGGEEPFLSLWQALYVCCEGFTTAEWKKFADVVERIEFSDGVLAERRREFVSLCVQEVLRRQERAASSEEYLRCFMVVTMAATVIPSMIKAWKADGAEGNPLGYLEMAYQFYQHGMKTNS